ncbi:ABC transporter substrate-binding protein [Vibrio xuii]|nr:ABC transporter substrate-binding protein [Vibrio xuii]
MNRYLKSISIFFLLLSTTSFAATDDKIIRIAAGEWPPFIGQQLEGFGHVGQTIEKVFAAQGYQVEFHFFPWKRAYKKASEGEFVATAVWMYAEEREEFFWFSDPVAQEKFVFFHLRDTPFEWTNLDDLKGKLLGGGLGYSYGEELDALLESGQVEMNRVEDPLKAFQLLKYRRVELVPEEKHIGMFSLNKLPIETQSLITFHPKPFLSNDSYLMFSKAHPQAKKLMAIFNQELAKLKASEPLY